MNHSATHRVLVRLCLLLLLLACLPAALVFGLSGAHLEAVPRWFWSASGVWGCISLALSLPLGVQALPWRAIDCDNIRCKTMACLSYFLLLFIAPYYAAILTAIAPEFVREMIRPSASVPRGARIVMMFGLIGAAIVGPVAIVIGVIWAIRNMRRLLAIIVAGWLPQVFISQDRVVIAAWIHESRKKGGQEKQVP